MLVLFDAAPTRSAMPSATTARWPRLGLGAKARAGIHVGPVALRANRAEDVARGAKPVEVDGIVLPIAARVMSIACGGQTLLSGDARRGAGRAAAARPVARPLAAERDRAADRAVRDRRRRCAVHRAGRRAKAWRVVRQGDLWQPVREVRHSLPAERDSFVGRQEPLQVLAEEVERRRPPRVGARHGRTGKTRLVTRFAWS